MQGIEFETALDRIGRPQAAVEFGLAGLRHHLGIELLPRDPCGFWTKETLQDHLGLDFAATGR